MTILKKMLYNRMILLLMKWFFKKSLTEKFDLYRLDFFLRKKFKESIEESNRIKQKKLNLILNKNYFDSLLEFHKEIQIEKIVASEINEKMGFKVIDDKIFSFSILNKYLNNYIEHKTTKRKDKNNNV